MNNERKVRWGILSTADIGVKTVIPAMQQGDHCKIEAIASRNKSRANKAAQSLGIPQAVGSYEQLLAMPSIEAIYNPLPNHLHIPWTLKALQAGKHVLCEKPLALSVKESRKLQEELERYPDLKVMEAFMYRHHPRWLKVKELVNSGVLGRVQAVHSFFSYYNDDPDDIRNNPDFGGGGLMDIGCYCISAARFIFDEEPSAVFGNMEIDADFEVDCKASGMMQFPTGSATFTCATQMAAHQNVKVFGTEGSLEIPLPFNPPTDKPTSILLKGRRTEEISVPPCNQYTVQGDLFSQSVIEDTPVPVPLDDAVANLNVLEAIVKSNEKGCWHPLEDR